MSGETADVSLCQEDIIDTADTADVSLKENEVNSVWHFGAFEFTSDALRFVLIYIALMMMLGVGLYNLTVQEDMSVKAMWAPIVSGSFFCMVPAPSIPKPANGMFSPATFVSTGSKQT